MTAKKAEKAKEGATRMPQAELAATSSVRFKRKALR